MRGVPIRFGSYRPRREVVAVARELAALGLNNGTTGNVSVRTALGFLITPSRTCYAGMRPGDLVAIDARSGKARGRAPASTEALMHGAVYASNAAVSAIVHHHGPFCTAWSLGGQDLDPRLEEDRYYEIGPVRTLGDQRGSTGDPEAVALALSTSRAVLLRAHGLVAVGDTAEDAYNVSRAVEHEAQVAWLSRAPEA